MRNEFINPAQETGFPGRAEAIQDAVLPICEADNLLQRVEELKTRLSDLASVLEASADNLLGEDQRPEEASAGLTEVRGGKLGALAEMIGSVDYWAGQCEYQAGRIKAIG